MAKDVKRNITATALLISILLSGCGKKSECGVPTKHVHRYTKEISEDIQIDRYIHDEHLSVDGYEWNEDYIEITDVDEALYKALRSRKLFLAKDNWDYLYYYMSNKHDYLRFYYEYYTTETYTTTDKDGKLEVHTKQVHHDGWTENPFNSDNTGKTRLYHHRYYGYRVVKKNGKFTLEQSPAVDDIREIINDYPYVLEYPSTEVYEQFKFSRFELPNLSVDDFDVFEQPDLSNKDISLDKGKILVKENTAR